MKFDSELTLIHSKCTAFISENIKRNLIFHYTSPIGFKGIVESHNIFFTDSQYLNDLSEGNYSYKLLETIILKNINTYRQNFWAEAIRSLSKNSPDSRFSEYHRYIASFSTDLDNLSLWNYYTKTSTKIGYNISLETDGFINSISRSINIDDPSLGFKITHGNVLYNEKQQRNIAKTMLNNYHQLYCKMTTKKQREKLFLLLDSDLEWLSLFFKSPSYKAENEYRIVITQKKSKKRISEFREVNGAYVPYLSCSFDKDNIKGVNVSPAIKQEFVLRGLKEYMAHLEYSNVTVNSSNIPMRF